MDERRARIYDDLRGVIEGELYFEPLERAPFAHDASLYEIDPLGVIVPRSEEDLVHVVRYASENQLPVHCRGAGTDTGGGSLGPGLVVDLSRHLRKVVAIGAEHVVVEPGVVLDALNAELFPLGRRLEPVPRNSDVATVGGLIAVDAAGPRSMRHGSIGDRVGWVRAVFAGGEVEELGFEPWRDFEAEASGLKDVIVRKLQALYRRNAARLAQGRNGCLRSRAGYALARAASDLGVHLGRLVAGSEGTLAIISQAKLRTLPLPAAEGVVVLPFVNLSEAVEFVPTLCDRAVRPASCDLHDRRSLSLAREANASCRGWIHEAAEAILIVEYEGGAGEEIAGEMRWLVDVAVRSGSLVSHPFSTNKRGECKVLCGLRRLVEPWVRRARGRARPVAIFDDVAVPPDRMARVLKKVRHVLQEQNVTWTLDAYAGEGALHFRPFLDLSEAGDRDRIESLASRVYEIVLDAGGTIASSQGCGLARTQFLKKQYGDLVQIFREVKDAFDPGDVFNPGKVIGDDPHLMTRNFRRDLSAAAAPDQELGPVGAIGSSSSVEVPVDPGHEAAAAIGNGQNGAAVEPETVVASPALAPALRWPQLSVVETASACNGCGTCRTLEATWRMCPSYRASRREEASPRSQANLIRQIAAGVVDPRLWGSDELKASADLCMHCKLCQTECPAGVDVSGLMLEAKAAYVENHGLAPSDWIFSRLEFWARLGSRFPIVTNFLLARRSVRRLLESLVGVSRRRVLPRVRRTPFVRRAQRMDLDRRRSQLPGPRVAYFVDVYANYYDQELAEAAVAVLREAQVNVHVPLRQRGSGMAALIVGDIEHAREQALANLRALADAVRDGYTVVCSEPTAALMLRQEYVRLTEDLDAELVAANTMDLGQYLLGLEERGQLPHAREPIHARIGYHQPCHLRALNVGMPGFELLRRVLNLDVEFIDRGCSGMGGTYGLARDRFWNSIRAGRGLMRRLRDDDIEIGATECGTCRIQMEQGLTKRTLHPIKLLSLGYGHNPSLRQHFKDPKPRHAMS
ncbi:MAG: FAD-binding and (Fe-S)-binding domain-containing protein [Isosphaeraceae bacterium]